MDEPRRFSSLRARVEQLRALRDAQAKALLLADEILQKAEDGLDWKLTTDGKRGAQSDSTVHTLECASCSSAMCIRNLDGNFWFPASGERCGACGAINTLRTDTPF
jgi:hypothetical protein